MEYSNSLKTHEADLLELASLAGITIKPKILSILIELLGMNMHPHALHKLLRDICSRRTSRNAGSRSKTNIHKSTGADKSSEGKSKIR